MSESTRRYLLFTAVTALAGLSFYAGTIGDATLRDPQALLTFTGMIGSWLAALLLAK